MSEESFAVALSDTPNKDMRWWLSNPEDDELDSESKKLQAEEESMERCRRMVNRCKELMERARPRIEMYLYFARLYYGFAMSGLGPDSYCDEPDTTDAEPIADNVVRAAVKAAMPRVCKAKPRPMFVTQAGRWEERMRAIRKERVINADIARLNLYKSGRWLVRAAAVFGLAAWHFFERDGQPRVDRILPWQIIVDPRDAYHGDPRSLHYWMLVDRGQLMAMYPEMRKEIAEAKDDSTWMDWLDPQGDVRARNDSLFVWFAWHLPSGKDTGDGRFMVAIQGVKKPLVDEAYEEPGYPIEVYRWEEPLIGWYGEGLARDVAGHQDELRRITRAIRVSIREGVCRTWIPRGANVDPEMLDDRLNTKIEFSGQIFPQTVAPASVSPQWLDWRRELRSDAMHETQTSDMASQGDLPPGIKSAVGMSRYEGIVDTIYLDPAENWEQLFIGSSEQIVRLRRQIAKSEKGKKVASFEFRRGTWREIDWTEADNEADSYVLQVYPVAELPSTPAGKSDLVELWFQRGIIDTDEYREYMDMPDTSEWSDLHGAPKDYVMLQLERIIFGETPKGESEQPDPTIGYALPVRLGRLVYAAAMRDNCPKDRLEALRNYLIIAKAGLDKQNAAQAPTPALPPGGPIPGAPAVPPMPLPGAGPMMPPAAAGGMPQ